MVNHCNGIEPKIIGQEVKPIENSMMPFEVWINREAQRKVLRWCASQL